MSEATTEPDFSTEAGLDENTSSQNNDIQSAVSWADSCSTVPLDLEAKGDSPITYPAKETSDVPNDEVAEDDDAEGWSTVNKKKPEKHDGKYNGKNFIEGTNNNSWARPVNSRRRNYRKNPEGGFSKDRRSRKLPPADTVTSETSNASTPVAVNGFSADSQSGAESADSDGKKSSDAEKKEKPEYVAAPVPTINPWQKDIDKTKPLINNTPAVPAKAPLEESTSDSNAKRVPLDTNKSKQTTQTKKTSPQHSVASNNLPSSCSWAKPVVPSNKSAQDNSVEQSPIVITNTEMIEKDEKKKVGDINDNIEHKGMLLFFIFFILIT